MKAFPTTTITPLNTGLDVQIEKYLGMDLRDYFAAKAMPIVMKYIERELINDDAFEGYSDDHVALQMMAYDSYKMADAMMKAREKK